MLLSAGREKGLIKVNCNGLGAAWDLTRYKFIPRLIESPLSVVSRLIIRKGCGGGGKDTEVIYLLFLQP